MTLEELAMVANIQISIRYPDIAGNYMCDLKDAEIKEPPMLVSVCGRGPTPAEARADYVREIRGKRLVLSANSEGRHELVVPQSLE